MSQHARMRGRQVRLMEHALRAAGLQPCDVRVEVRRALRLDVAGGALGSPDAVDNPKGE